MNSFRQLMVVQMGLLIWVSYICLSVQKWYLRVSLEYLLGMWEGTSSGFEILINLPFIIPRNHLCAKPFLTLRCLGKHSIHLEPVLLWAGDVFCEVFLILQFLLQNFWLSFYSWWFTSHLAWVAQWMSKASCKPGFFHVKYCLCVLVMRHYCQPWRKLVLEENGAGGVVKTFEILQQKGHIFQVEVLCKEWENKPWFAIDSFIENVCSGEGKFCFFFRTGSSV